MHSQRCLGFLRAAFKPPKFIKDSQVYVLMYRYILFHLECQTVPSAVSAQDMPIIAMI